jgi:hypothetical protein
LRGFLLIKSAAEGISDPPKGAAAGKPEVNLDTNPDTPIFREIEIAFVLLVILVDERGFEPPTSSLRTRKNLS